MKRTILILVYSLFISSMALGAVGKVIPRDELPEDIKAKSAKPESKYKKAGIPACRMGRVVTDWGTVMDLDDMSEEQVSKHPCGEEKDIFVCAAFNRISIRCANPQEN